MFRQWLTLVIIVLVYIPVAIDATVLHVAAPTLSMTLGASGNDCCGSLIFILWSWLAWCCRWARLAIVSVLNAC